MMRQQAMVQAFHEKFGSLIQTTPQFPDSRVQEFRVKLIFEEADEFAAACEAGHLAEAADALGDLLYVTLGAAAAFGVDLEPIFEKIHEANMLKFGGGQREDGKIRKPENWSHPDIAALLRLQGAST